MANLTVPIQVNLPDDWVDQVVNRLRNDTDAEWATVVRCKDCKYGSPNGKYGCKCYHYRLYETHEMKPEDFCSYGEEKSDGRPD